ncbi:MAG: D-alanyl-D-alanine carboxypeptidase/D-alanyl-D-alanine-endopeptidase [Acidimicrobiia bacterium]
MAALLAAAGCSPGTHRAPERSAPTLVAPLLEAAPASPPPVVAAPVLPTTTTTPAVEALPEAAEAPPPLEPAPAGLVESVRERLADPRFAGSDLGVSVWVDGSGEVVAHGADVPLRPGSTEKLLVAAAALAVIGPTTTLATELRSDGPEDGGVLRGDLVLVGGGDPTLRSRGPHSLDELARRLRDRGVTVVDGDLIGDESRFDDRRSAPGWRDIHVPTFVGPLSALAVDGNWLRADPEYVADPVRGNVAAMRDSLRRVGIAVTGGDGLRAATPESVALASVASVPVSALVAGMLGRSDNFAAELLLKEVGLRATGRGTTADGLAAAHEAVAALGVTLSGRSADGSGLSRENVRPVREWRELLGAVRSQAWGEALVQGLPVAGRSGTLENRFRGTAAEGAVRAKTGSVRESRALSGYLTTAGGRTVVFSLVVAGPTASGALGAMDALVATLVANPA